MHVFSTLTPIVLVIALGTALRGSGFVTAGLFRETNRLVYWVGLPCLLFYKIAGTDIQYGIALRICGTLAVGTVACLVLAYVLCWLMRLQRHEQGAFVQGAYRGNLAYVGLPVVLYSLDGLAGSSMSAADGVAVVSIAPLIPFYNISAVIVLLWGQHRDGDASAGERIGQVMRRLWTNPLIIACVLGIAYSLTDYALPAVFRRTFVTIGQMALPLALLGIGATLSPGALRGHLCTATVAASIKVVAAPLAGYVAGRALGLSGPELRIALLYLACPTAISSVILAEQLNAHRNLGSSIVVVSTLLAVPVLGVILYLL